MTRSEALGLLNGAKPCSFMDLDSVFRAFGFVSSTPSFETEVYYHLVYSCGAFTARDDGHHTLTDHQRRIVAAMIDCVVFNEAYAPGS